MCPVRERMRGVTALWALDAGTNGHHGLVPFTWTDTPPGSHCLPLFLQSGGQFKRTIAVVTLRVLGEL